MKLGQKMSELIYSVFRKFKNKYLLTILLTALLPLVVALVLVLNITARQFQSQQVSMMLSETSVVETALEEKINNIYLGSRYLSNYLSRAIPTTVQKEKNQSYNELQKLEQIQYNISFLKPLCGLKHIQIYSDKIPYLTSQTDSIEPMSALNALTEIHPEILHQPSGGKLHFFVTAPTEVQFYKGNLFEGKISFYEAIYTVKKEILAVFLLENDANFFLDCTSRLPGSQILITDSTGSLICSNLSEELQQLLNSAVFSDEASYLIQDHYFIQKSHIELAGWDVTIATSLPPAVSPWQMLSSAYLFILVFTFIFSIGISVLLSNFQAHRLQKYYMAISSIDPIEPQQAAELPDKLDQMLNNIHNPDEIDQVMGKFSGLIRDHLRLTESVKQREMEIEKYKFKVLQEQINPHFLYNALETLRLCMILNRSDDALKSLDSLSRFYRLALSKGRDMLLIREELEMITNYLQIENIGYSGSVSWEMDVEKECLDYPIPKFLLQPLIENSILHSRSSQQQTPLKIEVFIHREKAFLHIVVRDNGSGIEPETLKNLQNALAADSLERGKIGFGLGNVNRRLKLFYGSSYGLQIRSIPGCTENIIHLPIAIL